MNDIAFSVIINNNGIDDIIFKTIMLKGEKGNSVDHVEKTSTSGLVDTYTIYLSDGTVGGTFTVTNGAPVSIDDSVTALDKTWSSSKLSGMIKSIDDTTVDADKLWSSQKINSMLTQTGTIQNQPIASFADGADDVPVSSLIVDINAVQAGSGDPSPSNVRPISGWSECNIHKCGINLWDEQWEIGAYNNDGEKVENNNVIRSKNVIPVFSGMSYYFKAPITSPVLTIRLVQYDANMNCLSSVGAVGINRILTLDSECRFIAFNMSTSYGTTYNNDISINYPATDTDYHAFNGGTDTISLGQTVYGGTLNVSTGLLTITYGIVDLGSLTWTYRSGNKLFTAFKSDIKLSSDAKGTPCLCDIYEDTYGGSWSGWANFPNEHISSGNNYSSGDANIAVKDLSYTDKDTFKTAMSGVYLVYELATPTTVQLTPTEVRSLLGNNNVFADTGDVDELVYFKTGSETIARLIEAYLRGE